MSSLFHCDFRTILILFVVGARLASPGEKMPENTFAQRKNIRLKDYDYSLPGAYMVTICANSRQENPFGILHEGSIELSAIGRIIEKHWLAIPDHYSCVCLDAWVVMPDHLHGVLLFQLRDEGEASLAPTTSSANSGLPTFGTVIGSYKSGVSRVARKRGVLTGSLWQRGFYEHVLRNHHDLENAREYIKLNPFRLDEERSSWP